jgi:NADH-quinone oxidoreductase subunit G
MPKVTINGTEIEVDHGTTMLKAAAEAGYEVPHFCYHPSLSRPANCRMCLVKVEGMGKLQASCYSQVNDGMVIETESDEVVAARKAVLEFILVNHPVDCPICDQAGECKLQDYYVDYDCQDSRLRVDKQPKVKAYPIGSEVVYDGERCILCTRCVRFCDEITETHELTVVERGDSAEIRTFPGQTLDNDYSMCTVDICPVGALTSRDFRFKRRVWLLSSTDSVCTGCATGCSVHLDHFRNKIQRYRPRFNPEVNDHWMCDAGRVSYKNIHEGRLLEPRVNGAVATWRAASLTAAAKLEKILSAHGAESVAFVVSPQASCEDLYVARCFVEEGLGTDNVFMGGKPSGRSDDFLIKADKNPNRAGVNLVWGGGEKIRPFEALVDAIEAGQIHALYMMGDDTPISDADRARLVAAIDGGESDDHASNLALFILQSINGRELTDRAHVIFPACSHAEKDGTFVQEGGVVQSFSQAFAAHGLSCPDWMIFNRVAEALGTPLTVSDVSDVYERLFCQPEPSSDTEEGAVESHDGADRASVVQTVD